NDPKSSIRDIALIRGRSLKGTVVGPDGRPLSGARAAGLGPLPQFDFGRQANNMTAATFIVGGLIPRKTRNLVFFHSEKKLAKVMSVRGDQEGPLTVKLEPLGAVAGRIVASDGKPLPGVKVSTVISFQSEDFKTLPPEIRFNYPSWSVLLNNE